MSPITRSIARRYDDGTYPDGFWFWLDTNWHIYNAAVDVARKEKAKCGRTRWAMQEVLEIIRWDTRWRERGTGEALKVNNNARAGLSRLIMAREPDLAGFFKIRTPPAREGAVRLDGTPYKESHHDR